MASLGGTPQGEVGDSSVSIAQAQATSLGDDSRSILMDSQNNHNESKEATFSTMTEVQDSQDDSEPDDASFTKPIKDIRAIIQDQLIERLARLPEEYFERHMQLQRNSPFWFKLFNSPQDAGITYRPILKSREWAEYVVDASRIFFEAGLSDKKVVSIIDRAIRFASICLLNRGTEKIYFEDGRNVFYEFASRGMPAELKPKYKAFLKGMRASILVKASGLDDGEAHSEPHSQGEIEQKVGDIPLLVVTSPSESSNAPAEASSMIKSEEKSDCQSQAAKEPPQTKKELNRTRKNLKRKERRKRARKAKLLSQSKDITESKVKRGKWWRQTQKRKEKMKKANAAARQAAGV
jgi:hypothetical protein